MEHLSNLIYFLLEIVALRREMSLSIRFFRQLCVFVCGWTSLKALISRLNVNFYGTTPLRNYSNYASED
nr:MAG TPA: hypothetical protein [Caudoviricetes sp.]